VAALVVAAPVAALAALAIKLTSRGPVFYHQERVGRDGQLFTIYKLRTMVEGAEKETGPTLAWRDDPRSTALGRILRATKLDEWPQFYNVLRGDMSVIGPRPERFCFVQAFGCHIPAYAQRHAIRPGITGLAQVIGGYRTHVYVKLQYDLIYLYNQSLWLDLWILLRTPLAIWQSIKRDN
jgi:lipopolysaccharide/colanic/teichoic acid biosynthesis glycosyltransferase